MPRYVDADRLLNEVTGNGGVFVYGIDTVKAFISRVSAQPTADVVEVRHGKWNINCDGYYPYCSECGYEPERPGFHKDNRTPYFLIVVRRCTWKLNQQHTAQISKISLSIVRDVTRNVSLTNLNNCVII